MDITESITVDASPDTVWAIAGDAGAIADWVPAIEKSHLVGDIRHATFAGGGGDATERIVEHDDTARTYVYEYLTGPLPLAVYRSRIAVGAHGSGAEVVWTSAFTAESAELEEPLAAQIGEIYRTALLELKVRAEA